MKFSGQLFTYDQDKRLTAFEIGPNESTEAVVFIGGLGDGYNAVPFLEPLVEKLVAANWSFIQAELSSSFGRYGTSNLQTDSEEMDTLISYLIKEKGKTRIVVLGHSTGCQDSYWHNKHGVTRQDVAGYILQAPVSDREHFGDHLDNFQHYVQLATNMRKEGKGGELLPIACFSGDPVTADRFYSLSVKGGDDDVFSTDLSDEEITALFQGVERPICWVYSENDEFYASKVDKESVMERFARLCPAIKKTEIVPDGDHSITRHDSQEYFVDVVLKFIKSLE